MKTNRKDTGRRLLQLLADYKLFLFAILILSIIQVGLTVYLPILIGRAVDSIIAEGQVSFANLETILMQMIIVVIANTLVQWMLPTMYQKISYQMTRDLRQSALEKMHNMPLSFVDSRSTGDIVSRLTTDTEQLNDGMMMVFEQFLIGVLTILFTLVMMFRIIPVMMAVVAILTPLSLLVSRFIATRSYDYFTKSVESRGELSEIVEASLTQNEIITLFNIYDEREDQFNEINERYSEYSEKATFYSSTVNPTTRFINALIYAGVTFMGVILILNRGLTVGGLTVFLNYAKEYTKPFNDISNVLAELQSALASANRLFTILDGPTEEETGTKEYAPGQVQGAVAFEDVDFSYNKNVNLIQDLNVEVSPGMKVAIVGPTGAGKSTMINLIMRRSEEHTSELQSRGH